MDHGTAKHQRAVKQPPARQAKQANTNKVLPARPSAAAGVDFVNKGSRRVPPPPPSSRRELPAPTPLVLPARLQSGTSQPARAQNTTIEPPRARVMGAAARKKAPPPPSSRRGKAAAQNAEQQTQGAKPTQDTARQVDAQWAAHLAGRRDPNQPVAAASRRAGGPNTDEPPTLPSNLPFLNLEGEISSLRPRPSEVPPEPVLAPARSAAYRGKTPSELSVLYQALPSNYVERAPSSQSQRQSAEAVRNRGYVPKAPHEYLPPPPPPTKRGANAKTFAPDDDEAPTQARGLAIPEANFGARAGQLAAAVASVPAPAWSPAAVASHLGSRSPLPPPTAIPATHFGAPRLPAPPPVPAGFGDAWQGNEWTDSRHVEALSPAMSISVVRQSDAPPGYVPSGADSVHPTAVTIPAPPPSRVFPTFGLPTGWAPVAGASLLGAALSAGAFLLPARGQLLIDVTNQAWASLPNAHVYLNDELACTQSPCAIKVDTVPHRIRVVAPGYQASAEESVVVTEDAVTLHKVQLGASSDTGIDVQTSVPNLQLYVDGRRMGSIPRKVMGLPPGEHTLIISGGEHFTTEERRIQLEPNQTLVIDDLEPKLKSATLELFAGDNAKGARVALDGTEITLPYKGQLEPGRRYVLTASRDGYEPLQREVVLDANTPSLEVPISLTETTESDRESTADRAAFAYRSYNRAQAPVASNSHVESPATQPPDEAPTADNSALGAAMRESVGLPAETPAETKTAKSGGTLNIVTSPSAVVLLDGRPVGKTPTRINVSAGKHSIVLIHAKGRKRASVNVEPGADKTIKASF